MNDVLADKLIELFKNARTKLDSIVEEIPRSSDQLGSMTISLLNKTKIELRKYSTEVAAMISTAKKNGVDITKAAYDKINSDVELIISKAKQN
jgi:F0F1-type ATP synthase membrane subunit b/b'